MIFDKIIKDLLNLNFFSEYKFRKRDSSFLLKTKGGKQFIEMDHWIDEATSDRKSVGRERVCPKV